MIIQCDHCSAKFRMDDSKLANGPVKVRCAKCKEVFVVRKAEEPEESFQLPTEFEATPATSAPAGFGQGDEDTATEGFSRGPDEFSFNMDEPSFGESSATATASGAKEASGEFDWQNASSYADSGSGVDATAGRTSAEQGELTAPSEFDFGDTAQTETSFAAPIQVSGVEAPQDDFAIDFGEVSFSDTPSSDAPASTDFVFAPDESDSKDKREDLSNFPAKGATVGDFGVSFDSSLSESDAKSLALGSPADNAPFGDFDFGDVEEPHGLKQSKSSFPMSDSFLGGPVTSEEFVPLPQQEDEVPPSSLTTRKKRGSLFPIFVIIGAIMLLVALVGSGVYFFGGPKVFSKVGLGFLVEWYGQKGGEEGDIVIRNVKAEYVVSREAGELFVVRGEALNNYKKPRASIQIKVALLGGGGSSIKAKTAFCGNPLSNEQLTSLPFAKIEEVMNNQFGDSLANLGVKPGNAIPFVVVINDIPKEASDYSVQVSGSTVATQ